MTSREADRKTNEEPQENITNDNIRIVIRRQNLTAYRELDTDGTIEVFKLLREYVYHEDELVNQRTTWFLMLNSFLFASIALVMSADISKSAFSPLFLNLVSIILSVIGLASSITAALGVHAAFTSAKALKDLWVDKYEPLAADFNCSSEYRPRDPNDHENVKKIKFRHDATRLLPYLKGGTNRLRIARNGRYVARSLPFLIGLAWVVLTCLFVYGAVDNPPQNQ